MQKNNRTYKEILLELNGNDSLAFKEVYSHYWERLYIYAFNIIRDKKQCEDFIQEIFLAFWKNRNKTDIKNLNAYLYQSLRFQIFNYFRDKKMTLVDIEKFNIIAKINTVEDSLNLNDLEKEIYKNLKALPKRCQEIFCLSRFENLSNKEIAEQLNISQQTVKNQLTTALKYLRKHIQDYSFYWLLAMLFNLY